MYLLHEDNIQVRMSGLIFFTGNVEASNACSNLTEKRRIHKFLQSCTLPLVIYSKAVNFHQKIVFLPLHNNSYTFIPSSKYFVTIA